MLSRLAQSFARALVTSLAMTAFATAQSVPFLPGLSPANVSLIPERAGYTHSVGTFLVDTTAQDAKPSRAIIRTVQVNANGGPMGPIEIYEEKMTNIGTVLLYGRLGYLYSIDWTGHPAPEAMPSHFFICAHPWCGGYCVYSYRSPMFKWRFVGSFIKTPLHNSVTP